MWVLWYNVSVIYIEYESEEEKNLILISNCGKMVFSRVVMIGIVKDYRGLVGHESAQSGISVEEQIIKVES